MSCRGFDHLPIRNIKEYNLTTSQHLLNLGAVVVFASINQRKAVFKIWIANVCRSSWENLWKRGLSLLVDVLLKAFALQTRTVIFRERLVQNA